MDQSDIGDFTLHHMYTFPWFFNTLNRRSRMNKALKQKNERKYEMQRMFRKILREKKRPKKHLNSKKWK